ncbi:Uncharacterized protein QTN25_010169 [Entamoeba marina]
MIQLLFVLLCLTKAQTYSDTSCNSAYCSACSDASTCTECIDGYVLKDNDCVWREDLHCARVYDSKCSSCEDEYSLTSENECISCSDLNGCKQLSGTTCTSGCDYCEEPKYYNTTTKKCQNDDNFCSRYDSEGVCEYCIPFYYLDENNICQKGTIDKCINYDNETDCYICEDNLIGDTGECLSYSIDNCKYIDYDDHTQCEKCNYDYQTTNDGTVCFICDVENCIDCFDNESNKCEECYDDDYILSDDNTTCTYQYSSKKTKINKQFKNNGASKRNDASKKNKQFKKDNAPKKIRKSRQSKMKKQTKRNDRSSSKQYISCDDGYYLKDNTTCTAVTPVENCDTYEMYEDKCSECTSGYKVVDGKCSKCTVENCGNCDSDVNTCDDCLYGYYYNLTTNECIERTNFDHCNHYYTNEDVCLGCESGYVLIDNACVSCSDQYCDVCDENLKCKLCQNGYFMNENFTCSQCADWCKESPDDSDYICTHSANNCYDHYGCLKRSSDGQTCLKCDDDYYTLDNGECHHYLSATGYDGKAYGCFSFEVDTYYNEYYEEYDERYLNFESYEPVDGVCENPYLSKGTGIVVVSILLVTLLLL